MGTPPPGCGYLFILGRQLLPYNQVITIFAGGIGDNAGRSSSRDRARSSQHDIFLYAELPMKLSSNKELFHYLG